MRRNILLLSLFVLIAMVPFLILLPSPTEAVSKESWIVELYSGGKMVQTWGCKDFRVLDGGGCFFTYNAGDVKVYLNGNYVARLDP